MMVMAHILGVPFEELLTPMTVAVVVALVSIIPHKRRSH